MAYIDLRVARSLQLLFTIIGWMPKGENLYVYEIQSPMDENW